MDTVPSATSVRFLSTPSARRATGKRDGHDRPGLISIHALREEGDSDVRERAVEQSISIHALREEGDGHGACVPAGLLYFYPRPPRGGRRS